MPIISKRKKISVEKRILLSLIIIIFFCFPVPFLQEFAVNKIEPPNWWAGMKWNAVQLMVYVRNLNEVSISIPYPGIKVTNTHSAGNANYFFIDIEIPVNLPSGEYEIVFRKGYNIVKYN